MGLVLSCFVLALCVGLAQNYFYPMKFQDEIISAANESGVKSGLIASVALAESSFKSESVSPRGAIGLMQLMPSTAEWVCNLNKFDYDVGKLKEPAYNLKLGAFYLKYLLDRFNDLSLALCAYNAGPTTVSGWLGDEKICANGQLKEIPFAETRNYLKKVNKNLYFYKNKYK